MVKEPDTMRQGLAASMWSSPATCPMNNSTFGDKKTLGKILIAPVLV